MYSWGNSLDDWARPGAYAFDPALKDRRARDARASRAKGPRTYNRRSGPDEEIVDPRKLVRSKSKNPMVISVDVTGLMARWPFEIFDRLPLLYNTLSQYRPDLEICFAAIGDAGCDRWPLQVTRFSKGFALESQLGSLYGEGGGGDEPESYGLFAWWMKSHVTVTAEEKPFLIVFGDATMHPKVPADQAHRVCGDELSQAQNSVGLWREVSRQWNTWFLRRVGRPGDRVARQWSKAVGKDRILPIQDEQRAVDYALGLVALHWGCFDDFRANMGARQSEAAIKAVERDLKSLRRRRSA